MSTDSQPNSVEGIGEMAGLVWRYLSDHGRVTVSKLVKEIDAPRDLVMQAVGWLAREGKIVILEERRSKLISLS